MPPAESEVRAAFEHTNAREAKLAGRLDVVYAVSNHFCGVLEYDHYR
jgi:hypothetical protein